MDWSGEVEGSVVFTADCTVTGMIRGNATVFAGAALDMRGTLCGDLNVEFGGRALVSGTVAGTVRNRGGVVEITGVVDAYRDAAPGAVTILSPDARVKARLG